MGVRFNPGWDTDIMAEVEFIADEIGAYGAGLISQNIQAKNRIKTGHMLDDGPYSERTGVPFERQIGLRGEDYFRYQNDGTKPRRDRGGFNRRAGGYNRGITPGEFVEDARDQLQNGGAP